MTIKERFVGSAVGMVAILDLAGKITLGDGDEKLRDEIRGLLDRGFNGIILNLELVPYIDSTGLYAITMVYTTVSRSGGSLKLLKITRRLRDLLHITKLLTVFEVFDDEQEAINSFNPASVSRP